jgi:hypothetical protein
LFVLGKPKWKSRFMQFPRSKPLPFPDLPPASDQERTPYARPQPVARRRASYNSLGSACDGNIYYVLGSAARGRRADVLELTQQLLVFGRKQVGRPRPLELARGSGGDAHDASLGVPEALRVSLRTTNVLESIMAQVEHRTAKVDHWRTADQKQRWCAAAPLQPRLWKVKGYRYLKQLQLALRANRTTTRDTAWASLTGEPSDYQLRTGLTHGD